MSVSQALAIMRESLSLERTYSSVGIRIHPKDQSRLIPEVQIITAIMSDPTGSNRNLVLVGRRISRAGSADTGKYKIDV